MDKIVEELYKLPLDEYEWVLADQLSYIENYKDLFDNAESYELNNSINDERNDSSKFLKDRLIIFLEDLLNNNKYNEDFLLKTIYGIHRHFYKYVASDCDNEIKTLNRELYLIYILYLLASRDIYYGNLLKILEFEAPYEYAKTLQRIFRDSVLNITEDISNAKGNFPRCWLGFSYWSENVFAFINNYKNFREYYINSGAYEYCDPDWMRTDREYYEGDFIRCDIDKNDNEIFKYYKDYAPEFDKFKNIFNMYFDIYDKEVVLEMFK